MSCFLKPPGPAVSPVQTRWHVTVPALHMRMRPQFAFPPAPALANSKLAPSCSATNAGAIVLIGIATDVSTVVNWSCTAYLTDYYGNTTNMGPTPPRGHANENASDTKVAAGLPKSYLLGGLYHTTGPLYPAKQTRPSGRSNGARMRPRMRRNRPHCGVKIS